MKPDSESRQFKAQLTQSVPHLNKKANPSIKSLPPQKLNPSLSKPLKQQIDSISRQQWISNAAYYKAEMRGFIPGYEATDWIEAEQDYVEMLVDLFLSVFKEDGGMTMAGLQQLAKAIGVYKPECTVSESELIRLIQAACHHEPCYKTTGKFCEDQATCQWKTECQKLIAEWRR